MQFKQKLAYIALGCIMLLSSAILLMNVRAQTLQKAQIAFVSNRDGNEEIYVMDVDGKNPRRLTKQQTRITCIATSFLVPCRLNESKWP